MRRRAVLRENLMEQVMFILRIGLLALIPLHSHSQAEISQAGS